MWVVVWKSLAIFFLHVQILVEVGHALRLRQAERTEVKLDVGNTFGVELRA